MNGISFKHISKSYDGETLVIDDFNLDVAEGEFVVILGPSGCGKSTLLRILAGLEEIETGEIYIDDILINDKLPKDRNIAMVFQDYALYPHMTVYKNIAMNLILKKVPQDEVEKRVRQVASMLQIEEYLDRKPRQLSGGQMQRVALARALVREPKVFLMDEPLSNLDSKLRIETRAEIMKLYNRLKTTTVYVTHDQIEAMTMATTIILMKEGVIQQKGTPEEIYGKPGNVFVAGFVGTPQMNLFDVPVDVGVQGPVAHVLGAQVKLEQDATKLDRAIAGVRAEDITLVPGEEYRVDLVENLGSEKLIYLKANKQAHVGHAQELVVKVGPTALYEHGDLTSVQVNSERIHLFDSDSEERIN